MKLKAAAEVILDFQDCFLPSYSWSDLNMKNQMQVNSFVKVFPVLEKAV